MSTRKISGPKYPQITLAELNRLTEAMNNLGWTWSDDEQSWTKGASNGR